MTDREIQELLLAHYKKHYILLPIDQGVDVAKVYCAENFIYWGVCYIAEFYFKTPTVPTPDWIRNAAPGRTWWGKTPFHCETVQEIRSALRLRIDILCKILNLPLNCCFYDEEGV